MWTWCGSRTFGYRQISHTWRWLIPREPVSQEFMAIILKNKSKDHTNNYSFMSWGTYLAVPTVKLGFLLKILRPLHAAYFPWATVGLKGRLRHKLCKWPVRMYYMGIRWPRKLWSLPHCKELWDSLLTPGGFAGWLDDWSFSPRYKVSFLLLYH